MLWHWVPCPVRNVWGHWRLYRSWENLSSQSYLRSSRHRTLLSRLFPGVLPILPWSCRARSSATSWRSQWLETVSRRDNLCTLYSIRGSWIIRWHWIINTWFSTAYFPFEIPSLSTRLLIKATSTASPSSASKSALTPPYHRSGSTPAALPQKIKLHSPASPPILSEDSLM